MTPSNRRVGKPKLPADLEAELAQQGERVSATSFADEVPTPPPAAPRPGVSRALAIARTVLGVGLVVGLSLGAALGARRYVRTTPRFAVRSIDVSGNARRTADDVASEAGINKGDNVLSIDLDRARQKLLADPWIKEATLGRKLPGTVTIQVVERDAAGLVALGDTYLASRDGEIFKHIEPGDPTDLPVVTGLLPDSVATDRDAAMQSIRRALDLAAEYEHVPLAQRAPLEEVHVEEGGRFTLVVGKSAVSLKLGAPPFRRKLDEAARVVADLDRRGTKADAILLDNEAHPERVVVRVR